MTAKGTAADFIADALNGRLPANATTPEGLHEIYDFSDDELRQALLNAKEEIESKLGTQISDEQLVAMAGGKTAKQVFSNIGYDIGKGVKDVVDAFEAFGQGVKKGW